jgi:hypothetical protein
MKPWEFFAFVLTVIGLCVALPPMLGWSRARLWFAGGLVVFAAAIGSLFLPLPKPVADVNCGTVVDPRNDWTGETMCIDIGSYQDCSAPDFHRQCGQSRSERIQYAGMVGLGAIGVSIGSGMTERRNLHGSSDSD